MLANAPRMSRLTPIRSVSPPHLWFYVYRDANGQYRWRLIAGNRKRIANSGEGYHNLADCLHAINLVASSRGKPIVYASTIRPRATPPNRT
jgi:uncharacterized protein YegP (UPF0339 family)